MQVAQAEQKDPLVYPVLRPETARTIDGAPLNMVCIGSSCLADRSALVCAKHFAARPYTVGFEVGLRSPGSLLQSVVDFIRSDECPVKRLAFFAPLGDLHPPDGQAVLYEQGDKSLPRSEHDLRNRWSFSDKSVSFMES